MCGISGIYTRTRGIEDTIDAMNYHQRRRGPDSNGVFVSDEIGLGHVRLSIIDLSDAATQPMSFQNLSLVYNGELYNYVELRNELSKNGYAFNSSSDTEVLLKAWHCWGEKALPKFNGMFAFAVLDRNKKTVFICRDQQGIKPVHYYCEDGEFIFASEISTITKLLNKKPKISPDDVANFLALQFVPEEATGLQDIKRIPPGHLIRLSYDNRSCKFEVESWLSNLTTQVANHGKNIEQDIEDSLRLAVERQMVSDVPVGTFLSGGVDSSIATWFASRNRNIHTFSIGFSDVSEEHDETRFAKKASEICGTIHHPVQIKLADIDDTIFQNLNNMDELNADTSVFLNDLICEEAVKYVKVCLSGAGGDELFGGYYRHQALLALKWLEIVPQPLAKMIIRVLSVLPQHRDTSAGNLIRRLVHFLQLKERGNGFLETLRADSKFRQSTDFLSENRINELSEALDFDLRYFLCDNILTFTDRVSMKHSLEVRVPFLDTELVSKARSLPDHYKTSVFSKKILLKKITAKYFPKELVYRKKQGFSAPLEIWMRKLTKKQLEDFCLDGVVSELLNGDDVKAMINGFVDEKKDLSTQIYSFMVLNQWAKNNNSVYE